MENKTIENKPYIELIEGAMFSGKSAMLLDIINEAENFNGERILALKPKLDKRDKGVIRSRDYETEIEAYTIGGRKAPNFKKGYLDTVDLIVVDECQFLDKWSLDWILEVANGYTIDVVFAGLNKDFKGEDFPIMGRIREVADCIAVLKAKCFGCGSPHAFQTRRVVDNKIVLEGEQVVCGDSELYVAVCNECDKRMRGEE